MRARTLLVLLSWVCACGDPFANAPFIDEGDDLLFSEVVPLPEDLRLDLPEEGEVEVGLSEQGLGVLVQPLTRRCAGADRPVWFCETVSFARVLNAALLLRLRVVETLVRGRRPSASGPGWRRWGPYPVPDHAELDVRLDVTRGEDGVFDWEIVYAPAGTGPEAAEWQAVVTGSLERGRNARRGRGAVSFLFDVAAAALGAPVAGELHVAFEADGCTRPMGMDLVGWVGALGAPPLDARFHYDRACDRSGRLDWAFLKDVHEGGNPDKPCRETIRLATRWDATGAGRVDGSVSGGEVPADLGVLTECWDASFTRTWIDWLRRSDGAPDACVYADAASTAGVEAPVESCPP